MKILKTIVALAFMMVLMPMISNAQNPNVTIEFPNSAKALEVIEKYTKALQAGDAAGMNAQLAPDAMIYGLGGGLDSLTVAQHKEFYTNSTNQYKQVLSQELYLPIKVSNQWNEGEWVLAWGINTATDKASGKTIVIPYHSASIVSNGKITMMRYWYDMLNVVTGQGFEIRPPAN